MATASRGRPRKFDEAEVREKILSAFWARGYSATSLDELSRVTGLVRPSLYGAFGSKQAMYLAAMDSFLGRVSPVREGMADAASAGDALERFFGGMLEVYFGAEGGPPLGCFLVGTALAEAPADPAIRAALAERLARLTGMLRAVLAEWAEAAPEALDLAAEQAAATMHSLAVRARAGEARAPLERFAERSAQMIARMLEASS